MIDNNRDNNKTEFAIRYNEGKLDLALLPVNAIKEEIKVWMAGEQKYGRDNWKKLWGDKTVAVAMASLLRHSLAILEGEDIDKESNCLHAAHIRCNAAMLIEHYYNKNNLLKKQETEKEMFLINYSATDLDGTLRYFTETITFEQMLAFLSNKDININQLKKI